MCKILELSGLFVCLRDLLSFSVLGGQKKLLGCGLLGGISTQTDTMLYVSMTLDMIGLLGWRSNSLQLHNFDRRLKTH